MTSGELAWSSSQHGVSVGALVGDDVSAGNVESVADGNFVDKADGRGDGGAMVGFRVLDT